MKISSWNFEKDYVMLVKLLQESHWIRYENGEIDLLPKLIINQPNIFLLNVNDNWFLKPPEYYTTNTLETIVKELMEFR